MKIWMINSVCGVGSTGRLCAQLAESLRAAGHDSRVAYGRGRAPERCGEYAVHFGSELEILIHGAQARVTDSAGFHSRRATEKMWAMLERCDPDVIHLHNLHGYYLDVQTLFSYLARAKKPVVWTVHDCWPFTGHCAHYSAAGCYKWRGQCRRCPQKGRYPASWLLDRSARNYRRKRELFTAPENMTLVAPSVWLSSELRGSFLGKYPVEVIPNGVDRSVFHNTASDLKRRYGLDGQKIALSVANVWSEGKGLGHMLRLAERLSAAWTVVLIGLTARQIAELPPTVLGLARTEDARALAAWYSAADVYVSASAQESMGMTVAEAIACETPVAAFDATATPEVVGKNGIVVRCGDTVALAEAVRRIEAEGKAAFRRDNDRFASERSCAAYETLYRRLTER